MALQQSPLPEEIIPNSYIILLDEKIPESEFQDNLKWAANVQRRCKGRLGRGFSDDEPVEHTFNFGRLKGFAGVFDDTAYEQIKSHKNTIHIEPNTIITSFFEPKSVPAGFGSAATTLWGLRAISHRQTKPPQDVYVFDESAGVDVIIFVLDSGIRITHVDLVGRASYGHNLVPGSGDTDVYGHGTHISGTVVGSQYGIARRATVVSVKIFDDNGKGETARTMAGLQWIMENAGPMSVVNMSLSGPYSEAFNQAVDSAVAAGLTCVVSAGNNATDASVRSPASAKSAICVGAVDDIRTRSMISNYGTHLSLFAPGVDIISCGAKSDTDTDKSTGTSMACAHVSGVAAYLISKEKLDSPGAVAARLKELATPGTIIDGGEGSPDLFLYNGSGQ